jgi:hypothetical protein
MRFVETKTAEQQSCLMLHRTRHLFVRQQNAVINSIRAHLAELFTVGVSRRDRNSLNWTIGEWRNWTTRKGLTVPPAAMPITFRDLSQLFDVIAARWISRRGPTCWPLMAIAEVIAVFWLCSARPKPVPTKPQTCRFPTLPRLMGEPEGLDLERIWRGCNFHSTCFGGYHVCYQSVTIFGGAAIRLAEQMASARATAGRDDFYEVVMHQYRMPSGRGGVI